MDEQKEANQPKIIDQLTDPKGEQTPRGWKTVTYSTWSDGTHTVGTTYYTEKEGYSMDLPREVNASDLKRIKEILSQSTFWATHKKYFPEPASKPSKG